MTNAFSTRVHEKLRKGIQDRGYTLGDKLSRSEGASGSIVIKGEKDGKQVALKISSDGLLNSFDVDNVEKLQELRRREREVLQLAGNHPNIPSYIDSFTIEGDEFYPLPINVIAMEYFDIPSIAEKITRGEKTTEREAQILLRDGLSALKHIHTGLPYRVLHRDVKTGNILLNHDKAILTDFDIAKLGEDDGTSQTMIDNKGYYPVDAFSGHPNPSHDLVALGHVAVAGISGKEIMRVRTDQGLIGLDAVSVKGLPVSQKYREFISRLIAEPNKRFQSAGEALGDLEIRLGTSLPVQVKTQTENVPEKRRQNSNIHEFVNNEDGSVSVDGVQLEGKNTYEILRGLSPLSPHSLYAEERGDLAFGYLQHAAQEHPTIRDALDGKRNLEDVVNEKITPFWKPLSFSGEEKESTFEQELFGGSYVFKRNALKKAREMDSWIREARISQGLEKVVDGADVVLTEGEKKNIKGKSYLYSFGLALSSEALTLINLVRPLLNDNIINTEGETLALGAVVASTMAVFYGSDNLLKKYFTNHSLKQKRLAAGLDEDGMREYLILKSKNSYGNVNVHTLKDKLSALGLKKKLLRRTFDGDGVKLNYTSDDNMPGDLWTLASVPEIRISATSQEKAYSLVTKLRTSGLIKEYKEISSGGEK